MNKVTVREELRAHGGKSEGRKSGKRVYSKGVKEIAVRRWEQSEPESEPSLEKN